MSSLGGDMYGLNSGEEDIFSLDEINVHPNLLFIYW